MATNESMNYLNGGQHNGPSPHGGPDDDDIDLNHPDVLEGASFTQGLSLHTLALLPLLYLNGLHYHSPSTHESPHNPGTSASLIFESGGIMNQGRIDGFAEMSENGHSSPFPNHQNEGEASPNLQSAVQVNYPAPVVVPPSLASDQGAPVDEVPDQLRCYTCNVSFGQRQALNRHNKDKHAPQNICPLCGIFTWSSGRWYLFQNHLEKHHPNDVHT
ncbi:hypothetical protein EI94DRAFT_1801826 [Lactarius quietus]|nr:hypothetical protein EI94DRAFT_1801826 [Lactarius quietus]